MSRAVPCAFLLLGACGVGFVSNSTLIDGGHANDGGPHTAADGGSTQPDGGLDAGTPDAEVDAGPSTYAGTYAQALRDFTIRSPVGPRRTSLVWDEAAGQWLAAYIDVEANGNHRTRVTTIRLDGSTPRTGGGDLLDEPAAVNTLEVTLVAGRDAAGSRDLVAWEDARLGNGEGHREIFAQFVRVESSGAIAKLGANFNITSIPDFEEYAPCVAFDSAAGYLVAWSDMREYQQRADGRVLFAKTVSATGALGPELRLGDQNNWQMYCDASGGAGRFLIAWTDYVPVSGRVLDSGYRARFVVNGTPGPLLTIARIGDASPDMPSIAWNSRTDEYLIAYGLKVPRVEVRGAILRPDGAFRRTDLLIGTHPEGAGQPYLAYSRTTNSYLLAFHAWGTTDAFAQELDPDGNRVGPALSVNAAPPSNGTYFTPVAAQSSGSRILVVMMHNWNRIAGTLYESSRALP